MAGQGETRPTRDAEKGLVVCACLFSADKGISNFRGYLVLSFAFVSLWLPVPSQVLPRSPFSPSLSSPMHSFTTLLLALSLPLYALADHDHPRRHSALARRARGDVLDKRDFSGPFTYYDITAGTYARFPAINIPS